MIELPCEQPEPVPPPELAKLLARFRRLCASAAEVALDEGRVAREDLASWQGQGDNYKRAAGVATLVAELQLHSPDVVRPQRIDSLIRHAATYDVLSEATGRSVVSGRGKGAKPSIRVIMAFAPLVERDEARRDEHWQLMPSTAERAKGLWVEMLDSAAPGGGVQRQQAGGHVQGGAGHGTSQAGPGATGQPECPSGSPQGASGSG